MATGRIDDTATLIAAAAVCTRDSVLLRPLKNGRFSDQYGNEWYKATNLAPSEHLLKELGEFLAAFDAETAGAFEDERLLRPEDFHDLQLLDRVVHFRRSPA